MKRKLFLLLALCLSNFAQSQVPDYLSNFPEWRVDRQIDWAYPCVTTHRYTVYTDGDSTIGSYTYKKVYRHGITEKMYYAQPPIGDPNFDCFGTEVITDFVGLVRQENNRFYQYNFGQDTLMYDFDLSLGQIAPETSVGNSGGWTVTSIDSVLINGNYHKQFYLNNGSVDSSFIIEGVGSRAGLFEAFHGFFESDADLICYAQNGTTYFSTTQGDCQYDVSVPELAKSEISIYPQPAESEVQIKISEGVIDRLEIINCKGQLIRSLYVANSGVMLDVSSLDPTVYFIRLIIDGVSYVKRLIIH